MKTARDFSTDCRRLVQHLTEVLPAKLGASMLDETRTNFRNESYGNDDVRERWADRRYEKELTYPKLRYTGRLFRSIEPKVHRLSSRSAVVTLGSSVSYAQVHNEGWRPGMPITGSTLRQPPSSTKRVWLPRRPRQRQFMGIGRRSVRKFMQVIRKEVNAAMRK